MNLFEITESADAKTIFLYIIVLLFFIFFFRKKSIKLNIVFAIFIAITVILYMHQKDIAKSQLEKKQKKEKIDAIRPTPKNFEKFDDVIDFYFSIQDFYKFNPQTYEESIENIEAFFKIYDIIFTGTPQPDYYYQIAESKKNNAINALHALIYNLPNSRIVNEKLIRAHKRLETILNKYLNQLYDHCTQKIIKEGRDWYTRQINIGPKEYNTYFNLNKSFTYQFY